MVVDSLSPPAKFCRVENGEHVPHDYGNVYFEQPCGDAMRTVIGPSGGQVDLQIALSAELAGPWFVLYVLLVPRRGNRLAGRYQSPVFGSHAALASFLQAFRAFFEGDGRHHVWVGSAANDGLVVYDQHDVLFGYGPIERYAEILKARGFRQQEFWFPAPHSHAFRPEYDADEERLMSTVSWSYFPLEPGDEWD